MQLESYIFLLSQTTSWNRIVGGLNKEEVSIFAIIHKLGVDIKFRSCFVYDEVKHQQRFE